MRSLAVSRRPRRSPSQGPPVRVHDTAHGRARRRRVPRARPASTSAASRPTTPPTWATPRPTSPSTCSTGPGATPATRCAYVQNVTDVDDPLLERADARSASTGSSWPSARPSCSARTWRRCGSSRPTTTSAPSSRSRWSIDLDRAAPGGAARSTRSTSDLYFSVTADPALRRRSRAGPRDRCCESSPSAAATPTAPGKQRPARLRRCGAASATGEPAWDSPVRPGPARLAHRVHRDRPRAPRRRASTCRAAAPTWSSRTTRCARAEAQVASPGERVRPAYVARRHGRPTTARRCRSRKGNLVFVSALRNSDVDPMAIRLALLRHHYRSDWEWTDDQLWDAVGRPSTPGARRSPSAPAPRPRPVVERVRAALADDLDAPTAARRGRRLGRRDPRRPTGSPTPATADAAATLLPVLDAALGLAL